VQVQVRNESESVQGPRASAIAGPSMSKFNSAPKDVPRLGRVVQ
jgi:hypothetical protein